MKNQDRNYKGKDPLSALLFDSNFNIKRLTPYSYCPLLNNSYKIKKARRIYSPGHQLSF